MTRSSGHVWVVCLRAEIPTPYADNVVGVCAICGCGVQHRPHIPVPSQLTCCECVDAIERAAGRPFDIAVTSTTLRELADLERRPPKAKVN